MDALKLNKVCWAALKKWGRPLQLEIMIEECAELIHAACKIKRSSDDSYNDALNHMAEEIADVEIMIEQVKLGYGLLDRVERFKKEKVERLEQRISN